MRPFETTEEVKLKIPLGCALIDFDNMVRRCRLTLGRCRLTLGRCRLTLGRCRLTLGRCRLTLGRCRLTLGRCRSTLSKSRAKRHEPCACNWNIIYCFQVTLSIPTYAATTRSTRLWTSRSR